MSRKDAIELLAFDVMYLTRVVDLHPRAKQQVQQGMVVYQVFAKNAEDAIARLREQEPAEHPIIEVASVNPAPPLASGEPRMFGRTILPRELSDGGEDGGGGVIAIGSRTPGHGGGLTH